MKKVLLLFVLLLSIVGCDQKDVVHFEGSSSIIIEKRVGDEHSNNYEVITEIEDKDSVQKVIDFFKNVKWETRVQVQMVHEPDYKINENYLIWVSPKGDRLEIINTDNSNYVRLNESDSSVLFKIATGKELEIN